ncbi:glycoside hydrolase family 3 N-terminal domain-containing protein [Guptibacillus algicola]|uniref:glycoside hydrolase family 3 N-terminal domain-containing protein n=1 Tax=Guptibacillus algicola TaxID=225844 RepID=UPI001CD3BA37|nr:glycoside hydrolase family 3 N-terminal domain-containing protein [Alkalihalobacillus algicola]MCA0986948.1 glycoside hydrolase family 3 C-terminal domain-containing protein [Alkalihalobacillus algicola]
MSQLDLTLLLEKMTLEEKTAQLMQLATPFYKGAKDSGEITGPLEQLNIDEKHVRNSGSVLGASGSENIMNIQKTYLDESRLGIPLLFMSDIVHGYKTIFPVPLAIGCSWDLELAEKSAEVAAREAAVSGVHVTFAPMVDLVRDPRWGRVMESTGEDSHLNSEFARAFVRGFQGKDLTNDYEKVAACVKHFAAYGAAEGGRDYNTVDMSERELRETYLPAYKAALDEGCEMVMTAFNTVDGIPASGNKPLMRDLLRGEWGFDGVLISDWGAIKEMIPHGVAEDEREAALKSIEAGVDVEMMTSTYVHHLQQLVSENYITEEIINEAVLRILKLKDKLGLFENPYRGANPVLENEIVLCNHHRETARLLAQKSSVLLKNDSVLPLQKDQKVALIGPFAESEDILGPWSWLGSFDEAVTLKNGISSKLKESNLHSSKGCDVESWTEKEIEMAINTANEADVIVLALGEHSEMSGEAGCRADIRLPLAQLKLVEKIKELNKPVVTVLFNGRPLDLHGVIEESDAVLEAWYPGTEGGNAIADLLFGDANPSGRLAMSFPHSMGQVPVYYNHFNTGRPKGAPDAQIRYVSQYLDVPNEPMFPFGYGLSYSSFAYYDATISTDVMKEEIEISVTVENTSERVGEEVVQLYVRDISGEVVRPMKELKDFKKVELKQGEARKITFILNEKQLRYHHADLTYKSDAGAFRAYIGSNSRDVIELPFQLVK